MTTSSMSLKKKFEDAKARVENAELDLRNILLDMIDNGMAKKIPNGYGGLPDMIIVAEPGLLTQVHNFTWEDEDGPMFWGEDDPDGSSIIFKEGELEWF